MTTLTDVLTVLHAQGSSRITLDVLTASCSVIKDWQQDDDAFPCVALQNGVRWFYDKDRRPKTRSGAPLKAMAAAGGRSFLGDLEGDGDLIIFEGERDWLTALSIGLFNAVCAGGAENVDTQQQHFLARRNRITVFFDNDTAGQSAAKKLCAQLVDIGTGTVKNAVPPVAGQDFSDWVESLPEETAPGIVLTVIREGEKMGKREARRVLREREAEEIVVMIDEFITRDGDPVVLTYHYANPDAPEDQEQPLSVRFAHLDVAASTKSGIRIVNFMDTWENEPHQQEDQAAIYQGGDNDHPAPQHAPELPAVVRPLNGDWTNKRVILFPTNIMPYGTSESLFDDILAYIDRYYVCEEAFRHASAAYVLLSYRYRDAGFETVPYIRVMGPPGVGKTRWLRVMRELCYRSAMLTSMRPPHLYRMLAQMTCGVTMILEELNVNEHTEDGREFVSMLNAGNQRGSWVPRMKGQHFSEMEFLPVFCPKAMTLKTEFTDPGMIRRCITGYGVPRDIPQEKKFAKLPDAFYQEGDVLRHRLLDWRFTKYMGAAPEEDSEKNGMDMSVWQNWFPVIAMVPESRPRSVDLIMSLAGTTSDSLTTAHQSSPEAAVLASCFKLADQNDRAWVSLILADLSEADRNARWERKDVLRIFRSMGIKPTRSKRNDGDGQFINDFFVPVDAHLRDVVSKFRYDLDVSTERQEASNEVM